jgi:predicted metalloprotease with PDZ domain
VATSLPELGAKRYGFGTYIAFDYDELIDHPVEMGDFALASFKAHGVQHDIVVTGRVPNLDMERLQQDLKAICETQIAFFEPKTKKAPMDRYVFLTMAVGDGYGGLEHRASTALILRAQRPADHRRAQDRRAQRGLRHLPGPVQPRVLPHLERQAHQAGRVRTLRPAGRELHAAAVAVRRLHQLLRRPDAGPQRHHQRSVYFKLLGKTVSSVWRGSGRTKQSIAESSFDAWTKYYRQDENAPNAIISYYTKGSLVGLAFDLTIRAKTGGARSLDDLMRALWEGYGRDFYAGASGSGRGVTEKEVEALFDEVSGVRLKSLFDRHVRGTEDIPLAKLYAPFGVKITDERKNSKPSLNVGLGRDPLGAKLTQVHEGGAAHRAGLSAGDVVIAIDGLRVNGNPSNLEQLFARYRVDDSVTVHAFRRDELMSFTVTLQGCVAPAITIGMAPGTRRAAAMQRPSAS